MRNIFPANRVASRITTWAIAAVLTAVTLAPSTARADDDDAGPPNARLTGFAKVVDNGGGSTAFTWISLGFLGVLALSPLFKDAKRTHLD